jgi:hypothetical protein
MRGRWQRPQAGPRAGASLVGRAGLISKFEQVHGAILERLERAPGRLGAGDALPDPL